MIVVDFPVGAPADVAELEYIVALQQTCSKELRLDATVTAEDIRYFLVSRHGVRRDAKEIDEQILHHLAASHESSRKYVPKSVNQDLSSKRQESETCTESSNRNVDYFVNKTPQTTATILFGDCTEGVPKSHGDETYARYNEEDIPADMRMEGTCDVIEESSVGRSGTHELLNGFWSFFPFLDSAQSDEDMNDKEMVCNSNDMDSSMSVSVDDGNISCRKSTDGILELSARHESKIASLHAYKPKLGEEDEWDDLAVDERHIDRYRPMDLVQQVALLCIPELLRAQNECEAGSMDDKESKADAMALFEVFLLIICNTCQLEPGIELTKDVLIEILERFGEVWPDDILDEMWQQTASNDAAQEIPLLTASTLMKALTGDIQEFPTQREFLPSTHWNDVLSRQPGAPLDRIFTASNLDYTADTYSSFWWANLAWLTLVITIIAYLLQGFTGIRTEMAMLDCDTSRLNYMGCRLANGVILWVEIFLQLTIIGFPFIYLSTMGNSVHAKRDSIGTYIAFPVGIATVVFYTVVCYSVEFQTKVLSTEKLEGRNVAYRASLIMGLLLVIVQIGHFLRLHFSPKTVENGWFKSVASGMERMERWTKLSAAFKVQNMLANALFCHCGDLRLPYPRFDGELETEKQRRALRMASKVVQDLHADNSLTLLRFQMQVDLKSRGSNKFGIWRKIISKQIQKEQGIWLSPRLASSNLMQWFIVLLIPFAGSFLWVQADKDYEGLEQLIIAGLTIWNLRAFIIIGGLGAFAGATYIAMSYVPSAISLTMQFRTGLLGSLRDKEFTVYRKAQETRTMLYGATVWGLVMSITLLWITFGSLAFFVAFKPTRFLVTALVINIIGFVITWLAKEIILNVFRSQWYRGFYRRKPANANILNIIMDCWNIGFSSMFIIVRFVKVFLCLTVNLGRVDVPFLSTDVAKVGPVNLDGFPISYRKDLLIHEAHRHPYLERLGALSLLKLRLGPRFGNRSGGAWRILFVLVLMPWMKRYRKDSSFPSAIAGKRLRRKLSASQASNDDQTWLSKRNEELERENAYLKHKLLQHDVSSGRATSVGGSIFTGTF